jgi:hypothetical protein
MNAISPLPLTPPTSVAAASQQLALWRGEYLQKFAALERHCIDALDLVLAAKPKPAGRAGSSLGSNLKALEEELAEPSLAEEVRRFGSRVSDMNQARGIRNAVVHGAGEVWIGKDGRWLWSFTHRCASGNEADVTLHLTSDELTLIADKLDRLCQSVERKLGNLKSALAASGTKKAVTE